MSTQFVSRGSVFIRKLLSTLLLMPIIVSEGIKRSRNKCRKDPRREIGTVQISTHLEDLSGEFPFSTRDKQFHGQLNNS